MSLIAALCTLFEIAKFVAESLTPWTMLFTHVVKLTCALAILVLDAVVYAQRRARYSLVGLGLDVALMSVLNLGPRILYTDAHEACRITSAALTIYAVLTYRRLSAYDDYARPVNVKGYGFSDGRDRDFSYSSRTSIPNSISVSKRESTVSSRLSIGSATHEPMQLQTMERTPSFYSHERDTQFDDYVARRSSLGNQGDLERAVSADFDRTRSRDASPNAIVVVAGAVKTRSRGPSIGRAVSYNSDHVLVAVPEEEAEGLDGSCAGQLETDRMALLGRSRRNSDDDESAALHGAGLKEPRWQRE